MQDTYTNFATPIHAFIGSQNNAINEYISLAIVLTVMLLSFFFMAWVVYFIKVLFKDYESKPSFSEWLFPLSTQAKIYIGQALFYWVFLGVFIRIFYLPNMPDEHWILLTVSILFFAPIPQYLLGQDMHFKHTIHADAPKSTRLLFFLLTVFFALLGLFKWFTLGFPD